MAYRTCKRDGYTIIDGKCPACEGARLMAQRERNMRRATEREQRPSRGRSNGGGTLNSTSFRDKPQRDDPSVTNTYFNAGKVDGDDHGHVKYRDNPDGTTDYLYARDVEGNEYDV